MTLKQAFLVSDHVLCWTCQTTTLHEVQVVVEEYLPLIVFTCKECGEETDEKECDISKEGKKYL